MSLQIDDFFEMYLSGLKESRIDKLWLAYIAWEPEVSFSQFCENIDSNSNGKNQEQGFYIDQIGM